MGKYVVVMVDFNVGSTLVKERTNKRRVVDLISDLSLRRTPHTGSVLLRLVILHTITELKACHGSND